MKFLIVILLAISPLTVWGQEREINQYRIDLIYSISQNAPSWDDTNKMAIINHHNRLAENSGEFRVTGIKKLVNQYPENYVEYAEHPIDLEKIKIDETKIQSLFEQDENFRRLVIRDRLKVIAYRNEYKINLNPLEYAKAYAVYNRFGSEALTDYTNIYQHYDPSAVQDRRVSDAFRRFIHAPQYKNENPYSYAQKFINGKIKLLSNKSIKSSNNKYERALDLISNHIKGNGLIRSQVISQPTDSGSTRIYSIPSNRTFSDLVQSTGILVNTHKQISVVQPWFKNRKGMQVLGLRMSDPLSVSILISYIEDKHHFLILACCQ